MKKVLISCLLFLSARASDSTVYKHYDVPNTEKKARLFIAKPNDYPAQWAASLRNSPVVQKEWQKHFVKSDEKSVDFILQIEKTTSEDPAFGSYLLSGLTLWILPTWGTYEASYTFSLTDMSIG